MFFVGILLFGMAPTLHAQSTDIAGLQAQISELTKKLSELKNNTSGVKDGELWARIRGGPTQLKVNEQGGWHIRILRLDPSTPYTMHTTWGDGLFWNVAELPPSNKTSQLLFFKHTFKEPGTYKIRFASFQGGRKAQAETSVVVVE